MQPLAFVIYNSVIIMTDVPTVQSQIKIIFSSPIAALLWAGSLWTFPVASSSHGLTCLLQSKMEFLLGNPFTTPVGHCIGKLTYVSGMTTYRDALTLPKACLFLFRSIF